MRVRVLAVGSRMPAWVRASFEDYARRVQRGFALSLIEIDTGPRSAGRPVEQAVHVEGERLLSALRPREFVVALDEQGTMFATRELAAWLGVRLQDGRDLAFLIGGPDGHAPAVLKRSDLKLSLSRLTLPHALVRVVLAEQLYRIHTVLENHPYHRE